MEVGQKVKIKSILREGANYGGMTITHAHKKYKNQIEVISLKEWNPVDKCFAYKLEGTGELRWTYSMFNPDFKETTEEQTQSTEQTVVNNIDLSQVVDAINTLTNKLDSRTLYDESMIGLVKQKVEDISTEELVEKINKSVDKHIKDTYGVLPTKKIELVSNNCITITEGIFHKKYEEILKTVQANVPVMLTGPAGAGKNYTLEQVAKALGLDFYFTNAVTQEFKLLGFIDANGTYQETQLYKAATNPNGALFFFDEVDASDPQAMIVMNAAIANRYIDFPCGRVELNENFRFVCAGNTYGTGADMIYVGRNQLDGATLDRFATIYFDYDDNVEKQLAYDDDLFNFILALRKTVEDTSLRYIVSMRATINATKLLNAGMNKKDVLISTIIKNMQLDDLNIIIGRINISGEWYNLLKEVVNDRNK